MVVDLYLASASPRRRELLTQIGVVFETIKVDVDENIIAGELPDQYVRRLALEKAQAGWQKSKNMSGLPVLGADTTVVCGGRIMGKPANRQDAIQMLEGLSGKAHQVLTGVAIVRERQSESRVITTEVQFRQLISKEIEQYWNTGEPKDKAGAYGIQGYAAAFVSRIEGSYSNVVGLPLLETADLLINFGVPIWDGARL